MPSQDRPPDPEPRSARLAANLDRCVKCGLCLPDCPTFRLSSIESASPRGRIALIEGLLSGGLTPDRTVQGHLDSCLVCRRCEKVCPSGVAFGEIIDEARERLLPRRPRAWYHTLLDRPVRLRAATLLARLSPPWLTWPVPRLHRQHRLARALYAEAPPAPGRYAPTALARGRVGLFPGCATASQQGGALAAALRLLAHAGFEVVIPRDAVCCGALARHTGDVDRAAALAAQNRAAFADDLDAIVSIASGCGVHLAAYGPPLPGPHIDICRFLVEQGGLGETDFAPREQHVLLHTPCTVENVYRGTRWARDLLAKVRRLRVSPVGERGQCCGSAGDYLLRHPETADRLREPLLASVMNSDADVLLTSNVGCAMHLAAGLAALRQRVEVLHPVELLARQLIDHPPSRYHKHSTQEFRPKLTGETT